MTLYVTRHGETDWNAQDRICGSTDLPLNAQGERQAGALAQKITEYPIDVVVSSPMKRAAATAKKLAAALGLPVVYDARLVEQNYGDFEGQSRETPEFKNTKYNTTVKMPGGESLLQVAQRVYNALDHIAAEYPGKNVLVVCHGSVMRVLHTYFCSMTLEEYMAFFTENCEVRQYEFS